MKRKKGREINRRNDTKGLRVTELIFFGICRWNKFLKRKNSAGSYDCFSRIWKIFRSLDEQGVSLLSNSFLLFLFRLYSIHFGNDFVKRAWEVAFTEKELARIPLYIYLVSLPEGNNALAYWEFVVKQFRRIGELHGECDVRERGRERVNFVYVEKWEKAISESVIW